MNQEFRALGGGEVTTTLCPTAAGLILSAVGLFISIATQKHRALESSGLLFNFMQLVT